MDGGPQPWLGRDGGLGVLQVSHMRTGCIKTRDGSITQYVLESSAGQLQGLNGRLSTKGRQPGEGSKHPFYHEPASVYTAYDQNNVQVQVTS
jgi:hypothetical protein